MSDPTNPFQSRNELPDHFAGLTASVEYRNGDVVQRWFDGRAVRHWPEDQQYHCLAYPCPNLTRWFYIPRNSHLCADCITKAEGR